jgi:AraC-like DNA-binding protein
VTEICFDVGFASLGTFSRTFRDVLGESPSGYRRQRAQGEPRPYIPGCIEMTWDRPPSGTFGEDSTGGRA